MIYISLYIKKRKHFIKQDIIDTLDNWIAEAMVSTADEFKEQEVGSKLNEYFTDSVNRQVAIEQLINTRKNLKGDAFENIVRIYERLDLKKDSLNKFKSRKWNKKAKGIYELYMMNQQQYIDDIGKYTNSKNEFVRMEAQTAIIGFEGFKGLKFLNELTYDLNSWQQIKLLEQLQSLDAQPMDDIEKWLSSQNDYVVIFALKLSELYQQFQTHNTIVSLLSNKNEKIRKQSIKTLGRIAQENTAAILERQYNIETIDNKKEILRQINIIGTNENVSFLIDVAKENNDMIRLEAVRAIANCTDDFDNTVQLLHTKTNVPDTIIKQVKYETAL